MRIVSRKHKASPKGLWKSEGDFSDWLVTEEGLEFLVSEIGIQIENARRESRPGDFPCDVVGYMVGDSEHIVVIENQWGKTNHDHLGKILTYAAVHKAMTAVWIAEQVSDDHRTVIDWLNSNTPESIAFFLAELKVFDLGEAGYLPQLDLVCRPNIIVKPPEPGLSPRESERREWRREFWSEIHEAIRKLRPPFNLQSPGRDHWSAISIGRSGFSINMYLTPRNKTIGIDLYIQPEGWKDAAFGALMRDKDEIEKELGAALEWQSRNDYRSSRIYWEHPLDPGDPSNRKEVINWFAHQVPKFYKVFAPRVKELKRPEESEADDDAG